MIELKGAVTNALAGNNAQITSRAEKRRRKEEVFIMQNPEKSGELM
jgi:hypothetical protein